MQRIIDIHCHPTFKPMNRCYRHEGGYAWKPITFVSKWKNKCPGALDNQFLDLLAHDVTRSDQSNFRQMASANVSVAFVSLFPIEKEFLKPLKLNWLNIKNAVLCLTGFDALRREYYVNNLSDYFIELEKEYEALSMLHQECEAGTRWQSSGSRFFRVKLAYDVYDIEELDHNGTEVMHMIPTVEGLQSFLPPFADTGGPVDTDLLLGRLDTWKRPVRTPRFVPPLSIGINHHFYNGLAGHAESMKPTLIKLGIYNQGPVHFTQGFTPEGRKAVSKLLEWKEGLRRVIIDIKHLSGHARKEFYGLLSSAYGEEWGVFRQLPLLCSHTGVTTYQKLDSLIAAESNGSFKQKDRTSAFHEWPINLAEDEMGIIWRSGGLAGLQLDVKRISGEVAGKALTNKQASPQDQVMAIAANLLHMARAVVRSFPAGTMAHIAAGHESAGQSAESMAWDCICIGSDFDGMVSTLSHYNTSARFNELHRDLLHCFASGNDITLPTIGTVFTAQEADGLRFGLDWPIILDKVLFSNSMDFLKRYFHDEYLMHGTVTHPLSP